VHENQQGYYDALRESGQSTDSGIFIEFMLGAIYQALNELPVRKITDIFPNIITDKLTKTELGFLERIAGFVENNGEITNYRVQVLTAKSPESVKKYLAKFVEVGTFVAEGENRGRMYKWTKS